MQGHTTKLGNCLERLRRGDRRANEEVLEHVCERLRTLARRMLRGYPHVRRWAETDDVLQNSLLRLHRALVEVRPGTVGEFYGLAGTQIRRELIDLARHYYRVYGCGAKHQTDAEAAELRQENADEPDTLEEWTAFHEAVDRLPEEQRVAVGLLWYEGLTQPEAASVLGVSLATVKRRWQAARLTLANTLGNHQFE